MLTVWPWWWPFLLLLLLLPTEPPLPVECQRRVLPVAAQQSQWPAWPCSWSWWEPPGSPPWPPGRTGPPGQRWHHWGCPAWHVLPAGSSPCCRGVSHAQSGRPQEPRQCEPPALQVNINGEGDREADVTPGGDQQEGESRESLHVRLQAATDQVWPASGAAVQLSAQLVSRCPLEGRTGQDQACQENSKTVNSRT